MPTRRQERRKEREERKERHEVVYAVISEIRAPTKWHRGSITTYSDTVADGIIERVESGLTLHEACVELDVSESCFRRWAVADLGEDPFSDPPRAGLFTRFARALMMQAEAWSDRLVQLTQQTTNDNLQLVRFEWEVRKWLMGKNHPRFAEKSTTIHEGNPNKPVRTVNTNVRMTLQEAAEAYAQSIREEKQS